MASRRISSLLSRSVTSYLSSSSSGRSYCTRSGGYPYSTTTAIDKPITQPLEDNYTKLLSNERFANAASGNKMHGLTVPTNGPYQVQVLHEPIGLAGQIIPWNFPFQMLAWKVDPALAEQTLSPALYLPSLLQERQCCSGGSRTLVDERMYDKFVEKTRVLAKHYRSGDPFSSQGWGQGSDPEPSDEKRVVIKALMLLVLFLIYTKTEGFGFIIFLMMIIVMMM